MTLNISKKQNREGDRKYAELFVQLTTNVKVAKNHYIILREKDSVKILACKRVIFQIKSRELFHQFPR